MMPLVMAPAALLQYTLDIVGTRTQAPTAESIIRSRLFYSAGD
jgi:hypothetical protein